jgi:hypothetical protein
MRHACAFLLFLVLPSVAAAQQEYPRAEVFGGYSYLHIDTEGLTDSSLDAVCNDLFGAGTCPAGTFQVHNSFNGWNAAAQVNASRWLGVKADLSGHYGTPITLSSAAIAYLNSLGVTGLPPKANSFSYVFGPVVSQRFSRYTVFGHALFGANRAGVNVHVSVNQLQIPAFTVSNTALAMAFGGGVDAKIAQHFALRGQADYFYTRHDFTDLIPSIAAHQNNVRASVGIVYSFGGMDRVRTTPRPTAPPVPGTGMPIPSLGITAIVGSNPGAEITDEAPNGVAALSSIHVGDVINAVDGKPVRTPMELAAELVNRPAGDKIKLGVLIRGLWQTETVLVLGNR